MKLAVDGFLGAYKVEIELTRGKTSLLAGENGAGKTSTITAAQAIFGCKSVPPNFDKKEGKELVHDAVDEATISLITDGGSRLITYPSCELKTIAGSCPIGNAWTLGLVNLHDIALEDRAKLLVELTKASVTEEQYREALDKLKHLSEEKKAQLIKKAVYNGAQIAEQSAKTWATELKGEFKAKAGASWGVNQGLTFKPAGWDETTEKSTIEQLKDAAIAARKASDDAVAKQAVSDSVSNFAGKKEEFAADLSHWTEVIDDQKAQLDSARFALAEVLTCSGCGMVGRGHEGILVKSEDGPGDMRPAVVKEIETRISNAQVAMGIAKSKFEKALECEGSVVPENLVDMVAIKKAENQAVDRVSAKVKKADGTRLHYEIVDMLKAAEIVSSDGLARKALLDGLEKLNKQLLGICESGGWSRVEIDSAMGLRYNGRDYRRLSDGQRYRCDATLRVAIAKLQKQSVVLFDKAEQLDRNGRNQLFGMLNNEDMCALVAMMAFKGRDGNLEVPNLGQFDFGTTYLIEDGVSKEMAS